MKGTEGIIPIRAQIIANICTAVAEEDLPSAALIAQRDYPFTPLPIVGRNTIQSCRPSRYSCATALLIGTRASGSCSWSAPVALASPTN